MAELIVPDSIEPIVGRRCWGLARIEGGIFIRSAHGSTIWPGDRPLEATCAKAHTSPGENCTFGVYVLAETEPWPYYAYEGPTYAVWGEVCCWGVVVKGDKGYRAQYTYPKALNLAHKDWKFAGPLRASYPGVPVRLVTHSRRWNMDIGTEQETTVIEPVEDPVPSRRESPSPEPVAPVEPAQPVKVGG